MSLERFKQLRKMESKQELAAREKSEMAGLSSKKVLECEAEGEGDFVCSKELTKAHILTSQYPPLRANSSNYLIICTNHQAYYNSRVYYVWYRFVKRKFPKKFFFVVTQYDIIMRDYKYILEVAKEK